MTLWHGRFDQEPDAQMWALNASIGFDIRLAAQDLRGSLAWAAALQEAGVLTNQEYLRISSRITVSKKRFDL